jgi:hypothetical protein
MLGTLSRPVSPMKLLSLQLSALALAAALPGQGLSMQVDDPRSRGQRGDALLSLEEAILVANGALAVGQLSPLEQQRIQPGAGFDQIVVDAAQTPSIAIEATPPAIIGRGLDVEIGGRRAADGARPVLAALPLQFPSALLSFDSDRARVRDLELEGGVTGITVRARYGAVAGPAAIVGCEFHGQLVAAIVVQSTDAVRTALSIADAVVRDAPVGIVLRDTGVGGALEVEAERVEFRDLGRGVDLYVTASGGRSSCRLWRCDFRGGDTFLQVRRSASSTQELALELVHGSFAAVGEVCDIQGNALAATRFDHHHAVFAAGPGGRALSLWPEDARFELFGSEMVYAGDVAIRSGAGAGPVRVENSIFRGAQVSIDHDGAAAAIVDSSFEGGAVEVASGALSPVRWQACEFRDARIFGSSPAAGAELQGCFLSNTSTGGLVTNRDPVASPWRAETEVDEGRPRLGATFTLRSTVPPGMDMVWDLGLGAARPALGAAALRLYFEPASLVMVAGPVGSGVRSLPVRVPPLLALVGLELYFQGVTFPVAGQTWVPPFGLPTGVRVVPRD